MGRSQPEKRGLAKKRRGRRDHEARLSAHRGRVETKKIAEDAGRHAE